MNKILTVQDLYVYYESIYGDYKAVDGVSFEVYENEVFGIAGESGCGKSTLVEGVLRLVKQPGYIPKGKVIFEDTSLLSLSEEDLDKIRWSKLAYIPQGSMNSLNPVIKIDEQMTDAILDHNDIDKEKARNLSVELLKEVGLPSELAKMYPHELSGGMKQRVIVAMAVALKPRLVIADEPTTALDVVMQRIILQLLRDLKENYGLTLVIVSHDMAAHAEIADRMAVMYAGKVVEIGSIYDVFDDPLHPYSGRLIAAIPSTKKKYIKGIPGMSPSPLNWPTGCRFHPRCPYAKPKCSKVDPQMRKIGSGRYVACHTFGEEK